MIEHKFSNYLLVKDQFLCNPDSVVALSDRQIYTKSEIYPGLRTQNLFDIADQATRDFAEYFAQRIKHNVFPGLTTFMLDLRFHINESFSDDVANIGWIHSDPSDLAGLVYLTPHENNFNTGTSIFHKKNPDDFATEDFDSRLHFNKSNQITDTYKSEIQQNWDNFSESARVANVYNRLVAYDAKLYHRPNNFKTSIGQPRKSLLFFIKGFSYTDTFDKNACKWKDQ